jgi:hypothetical protein
MANEKDLTQKCELQIFDKRYKGSIKTAGAFPGLLIEAIPILESHMNGVK